MSNLQIITEKLSLKTSVKNQQNIIAISIKGILDSTTADKLNKVFDSCFTQHIYKFIVDLSELERLGSAGIGVFIGILDALEQNKGTIVFIHPTPKVKSTFNLFRLTTFYSITDDRESALKELQALSK